MKRDRMRVLGWSLVGLGCAICLLTIGTLPFRTANYDESLRMWFLARSLRGDVIRMGGEVNTLLGPPPATPAEVTVAGLLVGAVPMGFGILLLAIRRPEPVVEIKKKMPAPVKCPEPLYPKATAYAIPPWEKP
jgi:hypothetical protein